MFLFSMLMFYSNEKEQIKIKGFSGNLSALYSFIKPINAHTAKSSLTILMNSCRQTHM